MKEEIKEKEEKKEIKNIKEIKEIKQKAKSTSKKKTKEYGRDFHYLVPLLRFKDLGYENSKRQGYMTEENKRQDFLKKLHINTNPIANYFNPRFHGRSWWPNGQYIVKRRYNHIQSGLEHYYEKNNVEQLKPIDTERKIKKDSEYLKDYLEFESITPGNYAITIEYCSSCEDHSGITLHGIEDIFRELAFKYEKIIKERFPFIKVYLKPADVDIVKNETFKMKLPDKNGDPYPPFPFINDQFKKCRIGAFEIQIATKDRLGNKIKSLIHSKLKTKRFPNVDNVLNKIVSLMPMFKLNLILFDQEDYQDLDKMNGIEVNIYLCNSKVIRGLSNGAKEQINNFISPGRRYEMIQRQKLIQAQNFNKVEIDNNYKTLYGNSSRRLYSTRSNFRPVNSSMGSHSNKKMNKNSSNAGNDIFSSNNSCPSSDINGQNVKEYKTLKEQRGQLIKKYYTKIDPNLSKEDYYNSSESVLVKVDTLPYDTYIIETKENCYFQSSITELRFNEINTKDNGVVTKYIGLWHQQKAILNIHLYKEEEVEVPPDNNEENKNGENKPKTRIEQIPIRTGTITISDADDPNSRYQVYSNKKGIYEYKTQPGEYKLEIDTKDFERDVRKIKLKAGLNTLNIKLNPDKNCELLIEVLEYNEIINENQENKNANIDLIPVRNAKVQIYKGSINLIMEGITNKKGLMKYLVDKNDNNLSIKITKDGYFRAERFFKKYSTMKVNDKGNYVSTMRFILVNQQRLNYFQKIIFISYANVCKNIFDLKYDSENKKSNIQIKDWQKEKGIFIATFLQEEAEDENKSNPDENNSEIIIKRRNKELANYNDDEKCTYEEIIRFGLQISPNVIKDEENYNDDCKVTSRDLIEYLRNICCEGNVYTPRSDFHINLPKVFNRLTPLNQTDSNILYINKNNLDNTNNDNNNEENSLKNTKRVMNDLYWDLGWLDPKNFIYYETSVFFDFEQKPSRLTYYEYFIEFLQALIDKQVYNSLFNYFHFNLSILTRGDRYLPKKIFVKKMIELIIVNKEDNENSEELMNTINFICNILCGYDEENNIRDDSISFNLLKKKVSSNIINFIHS